MNGAAGRRVYGLVSSTTGRGASARSSAAGQGGGARPRRGGPRRRFWADARQQPVGRRSRGRWRRGAPSRVTRRAANWPRSSSAPPREGALDVPVGRRAEGHALALALDDQPGGHGLHPPGGEPGSDLAPQHRRDLVAVRGGRGCGGSPGRRRGGSSRSRVFSSARWIASLVISWKTMRLTGTLGWSTLEQVPGDGLALAVLVRGEVELVGVLEGPLELGDLLLLVGVDDVVGLEVVVDVDRELAERALLHVRGQLGRAAGGRGCGRRWPRPRTPGRGSRRWCAPSSGDSTITSLRELVTRTYLTSVEAGRPSGPGVSW